MRLLCGFNGRRPAICSDEAGASALEFALLAPLLVVAFLATVDVGLAINEKMEIDHSLRGGSEGAMIDLGQTQVRDMVKAIASESLAVSSGEGDLQTGLDNLAVDVVRFCACPESVSASVECSTNTCTDSKKPYLYYRLSAKKKYSSILLPKIPIEGSMLVQVK